MSYAFVCDWCGDEIEDSGYVELKVKAARDAIYENGWVAHYHATDDLDCLAVVRANVLDPAHGWGRALADLPVAEPERPTPPTRQMARAMSSPVTGGLEVGRVVDHPPSATALYRNGVRTLEEVAQRSEFDLLTMERVGRGTIARLKSALADHGLSLREGPSPSEVGDRLRQLRHAQGMSQAEVARAIDAGTERAGFRRYEIYQGAVAAWEAGRRVPIRKWLERLADLFQVPVDQLLGGTA